MNEYFTFYPKDTINTVELKALRANTIPEQFMRNQVLLIKSNLMMQAGLITIERWKRYIEEILEINQTNKMGIIMTADRDFRIVKLFRQEERVH